MSTREFEAGFRYALRRIEEQFGDERLYEDYYSYPSAEEPITLLRDLAYNMFTPDSVKKADREAEEAARLAKRRWASAVRATADKAAWEERKRARQVEAERNALYEAEMLPAIEKVVAENQRPDETPYETQVRLMVEQANRDRP